MNQINGERNYLVYMHVNKSNDKVYIGITSKLPHQRWGLNGNQYKKSQTAFFRALKKYPDWDNDWDHIILRKDLTKDEACDAEVELIAKYRSNCCRYKDPSYGYNMTDGGEGRNGSCGLNGEHNPSYGKTGKLNSRSKPVYCIEDGLYFESICIASKKYNISTSQISHRCKNQLTHADIDKHFLYEEDVCPELIAKCLLQKRCYRVYCIETKKWFDNAIDASIYAKVDVGNIRNSCKKLGQISAGKSPDLGDSLHWLYEKDVNDINIQNALNYKEYADKHMHHSVYCIEMNMYYHSIACASNELNINECSICNNCNGKYSYAGRHPITGEKLHWLYKENVSIENIQNALAVSRKIRSSEHKNVKRIYCIELDMEFESIKSGSDYVGIDPSCISAQLHGDQKSAGKHPKTGEKLHWELI